MKAQLVCEEGGPRLDAFLAQRMPGYSRTFLQGLVERGRVTVGGIRREAAFRLKTGDSVDVEWPEGAAGPDLSKRVLYEDADVFLLNKPAGLLIHPAGTSWLDRPDAALAEDEPSLAAVLIRTRPEQKALPRCGIVHRLDRETSGILAVAKTRAAFEALSLAFRERLVAKTYRAVVAGVVARNSGTVDAPIGRQGKRMAVTRLGREAVTEYKVLERGPKASLVEATPLTGRTHQIRAHLALAGHPVAGDPEHPSALRAPPRMMLHAYRLVFSHPRTGRKVSKTARVPDDFASYWRSLERKK